MPGISDEYRGVNVPGQPLVTSASPVVGPDSVSLLSDAFRKGVITADDIISRVGEVAQAHKKAQLQEAGEFVSPEAIQARQGARQAATSRAALDVAQTSAALPMVPQQADVATEALRKQKAEQLYGNGIQAYQQYAALFGAPAVIDSNGKPDYDAMGVEGNHMLSVLAQRSYAQQMLTPEGAPQQIVTPQGAFTRKVNKAGEDISDGSPMWKYYRSVLTQPLKTKMVPNATGGPATTPPESAPAAAAPAAASAATPVQGMAPGQLIEPKTVDQARAQLVNSGVPISQAVNMDATDVLQAFHQLSAPAERPMVEPAAPSAVAPAAGPVVESKTSIGTYQPGTGLKTGKGTEEFSSTDLMDQLHKQKAYEQWDSQKGFANAFKTAADRIAQVPVEDQRSGKVPMNALDIALAESIIKLYDPQGAIREFKWDKLADAQPYLEKLPNWRAEFLHSGTLTPEGRNRLVELGYDNVKGKEDAVRSQIQLAETKAKASGLDINQVLNPDELRVLRGESFGGHAQKGATNASQPGTVSGRKGPVVNVPGIGNVYLGDDGQYHRVGP